MKKTLLSLALILSMLFPVPFGVWAADTSNTYTLDNLHFTNLNGETITDPPGSCMAAVRMLNNSNSGRTDLLIISAYSADNQLISFNVLSAFCQSRSFQDFSALINVPAGKKLGVVKAYVWDGIKTMNAMSNTLFTEFNPLEGLQRVQFSTSLVDDSSDGYQFGKTGENDFIRFYETSSASKPTKYTFDDAGALLYVNGVAKGKLNEDYFQKFILENYNGNVELLDTYTDIAPADGYYDIVNVTYYATARVESVSARTGRITFKSYSSNCASGMTLDDKNAEVEYSITFNGEKIKVTDLQEDDILTIAYDSSDKDSFKDSKFYDVTVSRDVVEGKYAGANKDDRVITLDDKNYEFAALHGSSYDSMEDRFWNTINDFALTLTREYIAYLDVGGRIFDIEQTSIVKNIAIVEGATDSSEYENYGLTLFHSDGTVDTRNVRPGTYGWSDLDAAVKNIYAEPDIKIGISGRVIEYMDDSKGNIISIRNLAGSMYKAKFKAAINSIGRVHMDSDTVIVDSSEYNTNGHHTEDLKLKTKDDFVNNAEYRVYGFLTKSGESICPFVLLAESYPSEDIPPSTDNTRLAVLTSSANTHVIDGEIMDVVSLLIEGEAKTLAISDDAVLSRYETPIDSYSLSKGDLVVYTLDEKGHIERLDMIFKADDFATSYGYSNLQKAMLKTDEHWDLLDLPDGTPKWTLLWHPYSPAETPVQIVIGPIVEKGNHFFSIGKTANGTIGDYTGPYTDLSRDEKYWDPYGKENDGGVLSIAFDAETRVYGYDYGAPSRSSLFIGTTGDLLKCAFSRSELLDQTVIPWNNLDKVNGVPAGMNIAIAKVVNGVAQDVFVYLAAE